MHEKPAKGPSIICCIKDTNLHRTFRNFEFFFAKKKRFAYLPWQLTDLDP